MDFNFKSDKPVSGGNSAGGLRSAILKELDLAETSDRTDPQFFDYCYKLATCGGTVEAIKLLRGAWESDTDDCAAGHVLSMVLMMAGDHKAALAENDKVLARFSYFVPGYCQRAQILLTLKRR